MFPFTQSQKKKTRETAMNRLQGMTKSNEEAGD